MSGGRDVVVGGCVHCCPTGSSPDENVLNARFVFDVCRTQSSEFEAKVESGVSCQATSK